jgi:pimeloyl-ACP methyl ester carboxylesterase
MVIPDFPAVYLLHGMGGSPDGSVKQLELELLMCGAKRNYVRPLLPHADRNVQPSKSVEYLRNLGIPNGVLVIGISLGGLVAAKFQESVRPDLYVFCINSPTWAGDTVLHEWMKHRVSLYSSSDEVIAGRTEKWPLLTAEAHDMAWLNGHDIDPHKEALAHIISCYMQAGLLNLEIR